MRSGSKGASASLVLTALFTAASGAAQEPPAGSFGERVEVEVVEIDVVVTGGDGEPVVDLRRGDFEVEIDGRPVEVRYFAAPAAAPPREESDAEPATAEEILWHGEEEPQIVPAAERSLLVVYLDQAALRLGDRNRAVTELREFLSRRPAGEEVVIAAFEQRLRVLATPTADRQAIDAAVGRLLTLPVAGEIAWAEGRELDHRIRGIGVSWVRGAVASAATSPSDGAIEDGDGSQADSQYWNQHADTLEYEVRQWADLEVARFRRSMESLRQLVGALGALDGRKSVVLVSGGVTTASGEALLELLGIQRGNANSNRLTTAHETRQRLRDEFESAVRAAQDARVALYTVSAADATPLQNGADLASPGRNAAGGQVRDPGITDSAASVARMAGATGGRQFLLASNLDERLERVRIEADSAYSLGVDVGPGIGPGDHRIEVRVRGEAPGRRELSVRHRESFRRRSAGEAAEQSLVAAATFERGENPLGVRVEAGTEHVADDDPDDLLLPVSVRIPLRAIALEDRGDGLRRARLSFRVALALGDGELHVADSAQAIPIEVPEAELDRALAGVWVHRAEVRLTRDTRRVALLVTDEISGAAATVALPRSPTI